MKEGLFMMRLQKLNEHEVNRVVGGYIFLNYRNMIEVLDEHGNLPDTFDNDEEADSFAATHKVSLYGDEEYEYLLNWEDPDL